MREVAAEALRRATSQKSAAIDIGISEGRLSHKLQDGSLTLAQLEKLGDYFAARLGEVCRETYAPEDPKDRIRRELREARQQMDRLTDLAEAL